MCRSSVLISLERWQGKVLRGEAGRGWASAARLPVSAGARRHAHRDGVGPLAIAHATQHAHAADLQTLVAVECHCLADLVVELDVGHAPRDGGARVGARLHACNTTTTLPTRP